MKFIRHESAIYAIYHDATCLYVGASKTPMERYKNHYFLLRTNAHDNKQLQEISNRYGVDNLTFSPVFYCSEESLFMNEKRFISVLCPICNYIRPKFSSDILEHEASEASLCYKIIKDAYKDQWVNIWQITTLLKSRVKKVPTKKAIGSILKSRQLESKRVGSRRLLNYFII